MINNSELRMGRFTSSQIYRLCKSLKSGKPTQAFFGYIEEIKIQRAIGRSTKTEVKTQPMKWGSLMEIVLFNLLGLQYSMHHKSTKLHPEHGAFWSGTPDLEASRLKTGEIKCFEPLHFGKLSIALLTKDTEIIKQSEPEAYWQAVSNSVICGYDKTEIIAYMPYKAELEEIMKQIEDTNFLERNGLNDFDYYFMAPEKIESLPYLPDDSKFSNINSFEFEIPKEDIEFLTGRVLLAESQLKEAL